KLSSDGSVIDKAWGIGTDVPVVADYDGDGKADIAVWRGADTNWYVVQSSDGAVKAISLGNAALNDVPVPGDYDGDGKADVAVWRASSGTWLIKAGPDGSVVTKNHGHPGDAPVTNRP
ncbi:MAG TPA: VCBS repeat-containing protein, partial [Blastocatellia bacterium]|nr:VCBS repeat-containing protein [Blastocatellia bacterium]